MFAGSHIQQNLLEAVSRAGRRSRGEVHKADREGGAAHPAPAGHHGRHRRQDGPLQEPLAGIYFIRDCPIVHGIPRWLLAQTYIPAQAKAPTHEGAWTHVTPGRYHPHLLLLMSDAIGRSLLRAVVTSLWGEV